MSGFSYKVALREQGRMLSELQPITEKDFLYC